MFLSRHLEENCCYTSISSEYFEVGCRPDQHLYSALRVECSSRWGKLCSCASISSEHSEMGCHPDQHLYSALRVECSSQLRKTVQASAVNTLRWPAIQISISSQPWKLSAAVNTSRWAAIHISISTQPWELSAAVNTSRWAAVRISIYSALRAQLTSSGETFRRTLISKSIRPCSTRSRRELPKRQQMALNSLAEGGGTPGSTGITVIEVMNVKVLKRGTVCLSIVAENWHSIQNNKWFIFIWKTTRSGEITVSFILTPCFSGLYSSLQKNGLLSLKLFKQMPFSLSSHNDLVLNVKYQFCIYLLS